MNQFQSIIQPLGKENLKEEQILSAFISKLPEGLILCNSQGVIRLCNKQARQYLVQDLQNFEDKLSVIGCPVTDFIDKNLIEHSLDEINEWLKQNIVDMVSNFILQKNSRILQVQAVPILNSKGQFTGFVLIFSDITQQARAEKRVESLLQVLSKNARSPLASIRAAIEAMREFPSMNSDKQHQFKEIIYNESVVLSDILNQASHTYASLIKTKKSLKPLSCLELFETVARRASDKLGIFLAIKGEVPNKGLFIKADPYSLIMAMLFVLNCLKNETGLKLFNCCFGVENKITCIDIQWLGKPVKSEMIKLWENQDMVVETQKTNITLADVLSHHQGALWAYSDVIGSKEISYLRFFIPVGEKNEPEEIAPMPIFSES
ncbi:MAG: PAS domain-containing protein, partial [Proteobacteria bacterium]|nr:PAS domain-containing protein [Pseudomonadota bacterium]MBU1583220.1 PAS domain-containing protein [Pseudomonadota bacterium]MBU2454923.1 PAS domain-containing protein [Pseudomonadota bacterium]